MRVPICNNVACYLNDIFIEMEENRSQVFLPMKHRGSITIDRVPWQFANGKRGFLCGYCAYKYTYIDAKGVNDE